MKLYEIYGVNIEFDYMEERQYSKATLITRTYSEEGTMYDLVSSDYESETPSKEVHIMRHKYDYLESREVEIPTFAVVYADADGNPNVQLWNRRDDAAFCMETLVDSGNRLLVPKIIEI